MVKPPNCRQNKTGEACLARTNAERPRNQGRMRDSSRGVVAESSDPLAARLAGLLDGTPAAALPFAIVIIESGGGGSQYPCLADA